MRRGSRSIGFRMTILPLLYTRRLKDAHTSLEKYDTGPIVLLGGFYKLRRSKLTLHTTTTTMARISLLILCTAMAAMLFQGGMGVTITVVNQCPYIVWAAASPGGGSELQTGQTWAFQVAGDTTGGRVWGRTGCNFDASGKGRCETGDCGGVLQCQGYGEPSATLAEYGLKKFSNLDFYDISLVDGFNVPMSFAALKGGCTNIDCNKDVLSACPADLKAPHFCKNACVAFNKPEYCCTGSAANNCGPNEYSKFFKGQCPKAYSYPKDDATSVSSCPAGADYKVVFCN